MPGNTVLIVAAGTGGHLYPGIAVARAIRSQHHDVVFAVRRGDMGKKLLEREGFAVLELSGQGWPRALSWKMLLFPIQLLRGFLESWRAMGRLQPRAVVGMGGYLSFPVIVSARLKGIPTLIHEGNVRPGVSNRLLSRIATSAAVSFPESNRYLGTGNVWVSGFPIRGDIGREDPGASRKHWKLDENRLTFLVFGGSLGATRLNAAAVGAWDELQRYQDQFQVIHVTGERDYETTKAAYEKSPVHAVVLPYCHEMALAYAAADLVICRAGASTTAELFVTQRPAILIPFPFASENHQFYNAEILLKRAAAEVILDNDLSGERLASRLKQILEHPERLQQMRQRLTDAAQDSRHSTAAEEIAQFVLKDV